MHMSPRDYAIYVASLFIYYYDTVIPLVKTYSNDCYDNLTCLAIFVCFDIFPFTGIYNMVICIFGSL